jgi:hypothetical protein
MSNKAPSNQLAPKPRPPSIRSEPLLVKCGHTIAFELYAKDPFRDARRAKEAGRACSACRQARVQAEVAAAAERRAKKEANPKAVFKPRLPDGARFSAVYDATATRWTGTLTIAGDVLEQQAGSLTKLLHKLDDVYRAKLKAAEASESTS